MVAPGTQAVFRCSHQTADIISWRVNGTSLSQTSVDIPGITAEITHQENNNVLNTLTILGPPEYNGTVVECVAIFFDGSPIESTSAAILIINKLDQYIPHNAGIMPSYYHTAPPSNTC